jgi:hypothetical protein
MRLTPAEERIAAVARKYAAMMGCVFVPDPRKLADWRARASSAR